MAWLLAAMGAVLVIVTLTDVVWTTLSLRHAGPLTRFTSRWLWLGLRKIAQTFRSATILDLAGPTVLFVTLLSWAGFLWMAWSLIFMGGEQAVLTTPGEEPADLLGRFYFAGFTISTLGVGDLVPGSTVWRLLTAVAAFNGLIVITVGITYLLAVVSAAVNMRQLASYVTSLGATPEEILTRGWTGTDFDPLLDHLSAMTPMLLLTKQQHLAYPILRYYHSSDASTAVEPAIALLDETVMLLLHGVQPHQRPSSMRFRPLRRSVEAMIENLTPSTLDAVDQPPRLPDLALLRSAGIDTVADAEFKTVVDGYAERRQKLFAMVVRQGRDWQPSADSSPNSSLAN